MATVVHREWQHVFTPICNVVIQQPLICSNDVHIVPEGQSAPVITLSDQGLHIMSPGTDTPSLTLGTNGVLSAAHLETQTINVVSAPASGGTTVYSSTPATQSTTLQVEVLDLPAAVSKPDGSLLVPIDTTSDSSRMFVRLNTSNVSGPMAITLDGSIDGGNTFTCPSTAAITAVAGSVLQTLSNQPSGAQSLLAYNLKGAMQIIEGTHYSGPTSLLRVCVCGTLADLHAVRTEGTVAFMGNPTHLRFSYAGLPVVARGAVIVENVQS